MLFEILIAVTSLSNTSALISHSEIYGLNFDGDFPEGDI